MCDLYILIKFTFSAVGSAIVQLFPDNLALHAEDAAAFSEHMDYQNHHNNRPHTTAIRHPHFAFVYSTNLQHTNPPRVPAVYSHTYEIIPMRAMHAEVFPPHRANFSIQREEPNFPSSTRALLEKHILNAMGPPD